MVSSGYFFAKASMMGVGGAQAVEKVYFRESRCTFTVGLLAFHLVPQLAPHQLYQSGYPCNSCAMRRRTKAVINPRPRDNPAKIKRGILMIGHKDAQLIAEHLGAANPQITLTPIRHFLVS